MYIKEEELENRFKKAQTNLEEKQQAYEDIRNTCLDVAKFINVAVPDGREKSLAITHLEEVMFWANAGIARDNSAKQLPEVTNG
jgi:hypothetical protein